MHPADVDLKIEPLFNTRHRVRFASPNLEHPDILRFLGNNFHSIRSVEFRMFLQMYSKCTWKMIFATDINSNGSNGHKIASGLLTL